MYPGLACQIHAGYMQDTCGIHAQRTYLLAACGYMQDTCKTCKIQGSSVYLGTADKIHAGYMQDTCRIHVGYMQDTCGIHVGYEIDMSHDPVAFKKTKHILRAAEFLRDLVAREVITLKHLPGRVMIADILTKAPARVVFTELIHLVRAYHEGGVACPSTS